MIDLDVPVRDVMVQPVRSVQRLDSLTDVWTLMLNGGFHHVPVCDGSALVGIVSVLDLAAALRVLPSDLRDTGVVLTGDDAVEGWMTGNVQAVEAHRPLREVVALLADGRYHAVPVVEAGALVGMVTTTDLARWLLR